MSWTRTIRRAPNTVLNLIANRCRISECRNHFPYCSMRRLAPRFGSFEANTQRNVNRDGSPGLQTIPAMYAHYMQSVHGKDDLSFLRSVSAILTSP